ncbi:metallophosphoesterase family protein [Sphingobacterium spiritivorum]|uniref:metallophosphoesterase family protein n=1 Tax=Sphingobacterium spiritivorum TaxID=258 RepID=UPI003DA216A5
MKILHTGDWHLGKKLDFFTRIEEQRVVLEEICNIADEEQVDAVIVAGDLFDTFNPPVEAVDLLYKTLKRLANNGTRPVLAIAGNHDSPDRINAPDALARECGIIFMGYPDTTIKPIQIENGFTITRSDLGFIELQLPKHSFPLRILSTPFANEIRLKQYLGITDKAENLNEVLKNTWRQLADSYADKYGVNILVTHLYMLKRGGEILEEPDGEKPIKIGNADIVYSDGIPLQIQYTALGHLHRYQNIGGHLAPVVYSGSPLAYSFSEAGQEKKVVIIEAEANRQVQIKTRNLQSGRRLYRKRFEDTDEAVSWLQTHPNALVELTLVSETFATSQDLKRIHAAHDGIIHIIPVVRQQEQQLSAAAHINLEQDIQDLFKDYFKSRYGQEVNDELISLFNEVLNSTNDTED